MRELVDDHFPQAEKIRFERFEYSYSALYETFPPEEAHRLAQKLEIHCTPKHVSWLNIAEIELSALTRQCLDRRIPDISTLYRKIKTWEKVRNAQQKRVDWQFTTRDARIKLKRLYPVIQY